VPAGWSPPAIKSPSGAAAIATVAVARKLLTLGYYGLCDGQSAPANRGGGVNTTRTIGRDVVRGLTPSADGVAAPLLDPAR
jgi:hypothetical protein